MMRRAALAVSASAALAVAGVAVAQTGGAQYTTPSAQTGGAIAAADVAAVQVPPPAAPTPEAGGGAYVSAPALTGVPYRDLIIAAADRFALDPALLAAQIKQESGFDPGVCSGAAACGLMQIIPSTARALGVTDRMDPEQSINGGARYLRQQLRRFGSVRLALAAYNAGPYAVRRYRGVPPYPETRAYVRNILAFAREFRAAG